MVPLGRQDRQDFPALLCRPQALSTTLMLPIQKNIFIGLQKTLNNLCSNTGNVVIDYIKMKTQTFVYLELE
jgi:hypothetical protein